MKRFVGVILSPGYARGGAWVLSPVLDRVVPRYEVEGEAEREVEVARLGEALSSCRADLQELKARLAAERENAELGVLDAHLAMLEDPVLLTKVRSRIREQGVNAEQAVSDEVDAMGILFSQLNNEYLRERAHDLRDVGQRLLDSLMGVEAGDQAIEIPAQSILVAQEILPSQAAAIDRTRVVGIVTESGGSSSHAAILARSMGVPFVSGVSEAVRKIPHRAPLLVNGSEGEVMLRPNAAASRGFNQRRVEYDRFLEHALLEEKEPSQTLDGIPIGLSGNVAGPADADAVIDHHLAGIGLLRTEFMFMAAERPPGVSKQRKGYQRIVDRVGELPVTIRTMDLGADKVPLFLARANRRGELPPARGLRFTLEHPKLLRKQCRAIMRCACGHGQAQSVKILLPMVAGLDDFERAVELIGEVARKEGLDHPPPIGAMIETPAAVFEIDAILERADFLSVGTNDLTQYMLAVDRTATDAEGFSSMLHPGVLRALAAIIDACRRADRPLSVCGEAAGNPLMAALLVGMGVRELSMSPVRAAAVRHVIRASTLVDLEVLAAQVLAHRHVKETRTLLELRIKPLLQSTLLRAGSQ